MKPYPHQYTVAADVTPSGDATLTSEGLAALASDSPAEFDGPGGRWSPETLLVAAIADCYVLTFRIAAKNSQLPWETLRCEVEGKLDRPEKKTRFTHVTIRARLKTAPGADRERAQRLLEKAESACLISNSLNAEIKLETTIEP